MALNKPGRCRRCGKPYSSTQHMRDCKGMSIHQRSAARAHRAGIQRASRHRAGNILSLSKDAGSGANASYYEDSRKAPLPLEGMGVGMEAQS